MSQATSAEPARWARFATLGLIMLTGAPAVLLAGMLLFGLSVGEDLAFFALPIVVGVVAIVLSLRPGLWPRVTTIVAALLLYAPTFWTIFGITAVGSFFDFLPAILGLPGLIVAITGSIKAIRARKRGEFGLKPVGAERTAVRAVVAAVAALAVLSGAITLVGRSSADASQAATTVRMTDFEFAPQAVTVEGGRTVFVENSDPFLHTFTIDELDIDVFFGPGSSKLIEIPAEPGTYSLYCKPHTGNEEPDLESDMAGTLTVT